MEMSSEWSEGVRKQEVWLSGLLPYENATEVLERIGQVGISKSSVWRQAQSSGAQIHAFEEKERAEAMILPGKWETMPIEDAGKRMGAAMDGGMIFIMEEGWKELKVGSVFEVGARQGLDERSGEPANIPTAMSMSYVANLGGTIKFGTLLWSEARRRKWWGVRGTEVVGDGAAWIWNQCALHFGESIQVVDWYHAKEHLVAAAHSIHGEGTPAMRQWLKTHEQWLYQGHARKIADHLLDLAQTYPDAAKSLAAEAGYFMKHHRRMQYMRLREDGWAIGSGMVESGIKQYKDRFCGAGMRWSREGAENLIPIRTAILSGRFDQRWEQVRNLPPN
jgi:hypothetical protein